MAPVTKYTEAVLKEELKQEQYRPVYCFYGDEPYLIQHYTATLSAQLVGDHMPDFNCNRLEGEAATMEQILQAAEALPVMHSHRCVLVRDFVPTACTDGQLKAFCEYLEDPCPGNVIVFYYTAVTPAASGKWKSFLTACDRQGGVLRFSQKTPQELIKLLCNGAGNRGCRMSSGAASALIEAIGNDMNQLLGELEKLCAFRSGQEITSRDVDVLCSKSLNASAFQMVKEINRRNPAGALKLLENLFRLREEPIKILGALASSYVNLYRALTAQEAGIALPLFGKELGMKSPGNLPYSLNDARKLGGRKLDRSLQLLSDCDKALKSLPVDGQILLEQAVVGLLEIAKE